MERGGIVRLATLLYFSAFEAFPPLLPPSLPSSHARLELPHAYAVLYSSPSVLCASRKTFPRLAVVLALVQTVCNSSQLQRWPCPPHLPPRSLFSSLIEIHAFPASTLECGQNLDLPFRARPRRIALEILGPSTPLCFDCSLGTSGHSSHDLLPPPRLPVRQRPGTSSPLWQTRCIAPCLAEFDGQVLLELNERAQRGSGGKKSFRSRAGKRSTKGTRRLPLTIASLLLALCWSSPHPLL